MALSPARAVLQELTIHDWHPTTNVNGSNSKGHWSVIRKRHDIDRDMAWASARQAGWVFVPGKVRLTITLVYPRKYRVDYDGLVSRCKGMIDGLRDNVKFLPVLNHRGQTLPIKRPGFFLDDDTEHLDLHLQAVVERGIKETRITLEPLD